MRCVIAIKGVNDYITCVDEEKNEVLIYQNSEKIVQMSLECSSAVYNGSKLLYTMQNKGSVFAVDVDSSDTDEMPSPYGSILIKQVLREFDNLILALVDGKYVIYDYVSCKEVFKCDNLGFDSIYDLSMNKYGIGQAAGFHKEYNSYSEEEWRFHAVTFRSNIASYSLDMELAAKFSLYENFYERTICYDSSTGKANFPIFYVYNDAYTAKAVSENYIVYVPAYEHHVVIVADIFGKIHRLLFYPETISNKSCFAYNEKTDIITIATYQGEIYRWYVNTVDTALFDEMFRIYDQKRYFTDHIDIKIEGLLEKALEQAEGVPETDDDFYTKTAMYKAKVYCRRISKEDVDVGIKSVLEGFRITDMTDDTVVIEAASDIVINALRGIYLRFLKTAFKEILGREVDVEIKMKMVKANN